jgi:hypothetical protein
MPIATLVQCFLVCVLVYVAACLSGGLEQA